MTLTRKLTNDYEQSKEVSILAVASYKSDKYWIYKMFKLVTSVPEVSW